MTLNQQSPLDGSGAAGAQLQGCDRDTASQLVVPRRRYRIVTDAYLGFEVQESRKQLWWWSAWDQPIPNTHRTVEEARAWLKRLPQILADRKRKHETAGRVVEYV